MKKVGLFIVTLGILSLQEVGACTPHGATRSSCLLHNHNNIQQCIAEAARNYQSASPGAGGYQERQYHQYKMNGGCADEYCGDCSSRH